MNDWRTKLEIELHRMENFNRNHRRHRNGRTSGWRCAIRKRNLFLRVFLSLKALLWCSSDYFGWNYSATNEQSNEDILIRLFRSSFSTCICILRILLIVLRSFKIFIPVIFIRTYSLLNICALNVHNICIFKIMNFLFVFFKQ